MRNSKTYRTLLLGTIAAAVTATAQAAEPTAFQFATPDRAQTDTVAKTTGESGLRPITGSQFDLFFVGEGATRSLPFFAQANEASSAARLVLTMQTAISVEPEYSHLTLSINGTQIGATKLAAGDPRRIAFDIPPGLIRPGYNAITFDADQRHRVDCSIDATYELWTRIDPARSGFAYSGVSNPNLSFVDLLSLSGIAQGTTPIRVVMASGAGEEEINRVMKVVQAVALMGNFAHPAITFGDQPGTGPGIDLYVGTHDQISSYLDGREMAATSPDHMLVEAGTEENRKRLIISGSDVSDLNQSIDAIIKNASTAQPVGSQDGLLALANYKGRKMVPGTQVTLNQLGYSGKHFAGRYSLSSLSFTMPSDFYPGAYSAIDFHLNARYAAGLSKNAVLVVKANEKTVANIPLSSSREGEIRDQRLPIPLSALRPGQNTLKIEARLPSRADDVCQSVDQASASARFYVDPNSYLDIPQYARVGRYPDLAVLASGLSPKLADGTEPATYLFVPPYEAQGLGAAASFVAKMAYSSGRIKAYRYSASLPVLDTSNVIAVGSFDTLPAELTTRMKLDFLDLRPAEQSGQLEREPIAPADTRIEQAPSGIARLVHLGRQFVDNPSGTGTNIMNSWRPTLRDAAKRWNLRYLSLALNGGETELYSPTENAAMVVAQNNSKEGGLWTVIAARRSNELGKQVDTLTRRNVWDNLGGAIQSFSNTGLVMDTTSAVTQNLYQTQPLSVKNMRLIAAGWFANNGEIYVLALIISSILLGLFAWLVLRMGRSDNA